MKYAQAVRKTRMLSALIGKQCQTELLDAPETLKLSRIDQPNHQLAFIRVGFQTNNIVHRIAVNFFQKPQTSRLLIPSLYGAFRPTQTFYSRLLIKLVDLMDKYSDYWKFIGNNLSGLKIGRARSRVSRRAFCLIIKDLCRIYRRRKLWLSNCIYFRAIRPKVSLWTIK